MRERKPERPRPVHYLDKKAPDVLPPRTRLMRRLRLTVLILVAGGVLGVAALATLFWSTGRTPREWAPVLRQAAADQPEPLASLGRAAAAWMLRQDRMTLSASAAAPAAAGADPARSAPLESGRVVPVASVDELTAALATAEPGDVLLLRPGTYRVSGPALRLAQGGAPNAPVVLRAARLGDAVIESDAVEAIHVTAPNWRIEDLVLKGVCAQANDCEHAIQVTGAATNVTIRNNRIEDFNAQIKINGDGPAFPDNGRIVGNTLIDTAPRATRKPMAAIDLVAANGWLIQGNLIADVLRTTPVLPTYAAYAKGAGEKTVFERNVVICEWHHHGTPGQHVGLSLGGGGTETAFRRDKGRTGFEQIGGALRDNLIVSCSDDGIYLNKAAHTVIDRNTLLDTAGIDGRYLETSATITANIVDGALRSRDGAAMQGWDNDTPWLLGLFLGEHPQRGYFRDPHRLDLTWRSAPAPATEHTQRADLCDHPRSALAPVGAFENYTACLISTAAAPVKAAAR